MKVPIVLAISALALLSIVYASEFEEEKLLKEVVRTVLLEKEDDTLREERDGECRYYLGGCKKDGDCCKHLQCHSFWEWCVWDGTVC
uniref:Tau-Theraphotoxin-Ct1a_1 n=1 Tax=Coremiocnemis tropix TaxID=1904443 RepID=A0A482ZCZ3_CORTR